MKLFRKLENLFAASAFAEAGEFDTARSIAAGDAEDTGRKDRVTRVRAARPAVAEGSRQLKGVRSES
ncbi:MAG: hypothetical protein C4534_11220 [Gaiellales bacterium]|nr:MAG: hypothetical protein C4534_11220 [Gaiellales bacterium]